MRISDWSSYVCSSDLIEDLNPAFLRTQARSKHVVLRKYGKTRIEITNHTVAHIFHSELENRHPPSRERFYSLPVCVLNPKIDNPHPTRAFSISPIRQRSDFPLIEQPVIFCQRAFCLPIEYEIAGIEDDGKIGRAHV